ncbi:hypothetical protein ACFL27_15450 [candidate division CSSED10-310 bacterium]|uniref:Uncharacterized protein n=1 Tax=candidate division CSSED10-310 bacterium TaxID=2855610 RepID=A0ABV6YZG2_UNCC1
MKQFTHPSPALAKRIMTEVDFESRFLGYRLHKRLGPVASSLYSVAEVVAFLSEEMPLIDFEALLKWIRDTIGDNDLGQAIEAAIKSDSSDLEKTRHVRNLMYTRLVQCKKITSS